MIQYFLKDRLTVLVLCLSTFSIFINYNIDGSSYSVNEDRWSTKGQKLLGHTHNLQALLELCRSTFLQIHQIQFFLKIFSIILPPIHF